MATLGTLVVAARTRRGMKQYQLADATGRQRSFISRIENDDHQEMWPPDVLADLHRVLGIPHAAMLRAMGYALETAGEGTGAGMDGFPLESDAAAIVAVLRATDPAIHGLMRVQVEGVAAWARSDPWLKRALMEPAVDAP